MAQLRALLWSYGPTLCRTSSRRRDRAQARGVLPHWQEAQFAKTETALDEVEGRLLAQLPMTWPLRL